jgi:signal transduction histidine kinase
VSEKYQMLMTNGLTPTNEAERLNALYAYNILDTLDEKEYDDIITLVSQICQIPIAFISFIDSQRQWFKASVNLGIKENPRNETVCQYTILQSDLLEIPNVSKDARFLDNKTILEKKLVFYAGIPLVTSEGYNIGTLCVLDQKERRLSDEQKNALKILANQVMNLLELRLKNQQLAHQNQELLYHKEHQSKVLGLISHDLRSPLTQALGFTEVLRYTLPLDAEVEDLLSNLQKNAQNALFMLDNTLNWAKMQINGFIVLTKEFFLEEFLKEILNSFEDKIKQKQIQFHYQYPREAKIHSDKFIFGSIIRNLLSNAIKFTPKQGKITLNIHLDAKKQIYIIVQDTGIGIPQATVDKILSNQPITSQKGTEGEKGAGVGMQILKEFIRMLNGKLLIRSKENEGTTFEITLPQ